MIRVREFRRLKSWPKKYRLATAYDALAYSLRHGGIMASEQARGHFYASLCLAIAAHRRHTETDYDDLLRAGIPREDARASVLE